MLYHMFDFENISELAVANREPSTLSGSAGPNYLVLDQRLSQIWQTLFHKFDFGNISNGEPSSLRR